VAGMTVSNPAIAGTGTWVTYPGVDIEAPTALRSRCRQRWSTLGAGGTLDAIQYWATSAGALTVTRATAREIGNGQVEVFLASSLGPPASSDVSLVSSVLAVKRPMCSAMYVYGSDARVFYVGGSVTAAASLIANAQAAAQRAVDSYIRSVPIGGRLRVNSIISAIQSAAGVVSVRLTNSAGIPYTQDDDVTLAANQVATWTNALSWGAA